MEIEADFKKDEERRDLLIVKKFLSEPELEKLSEEAVVKKKDRVSTGIPGLDNIIEGGFIPNSVVMISGETGTGKTIFCTQFIWNALCLGENGLYVSLQQTADEIKKDVAIFGRDFRRAETLGQCRIIYTEPQDMRKIIAIILRNVKELKAKRVVIDSITMLAEYAEKKRDIRFHLSRLIQELKEMGVTALVTSEIDERTSSLSKFGIEEYLVDGVIALKCGVDVGLGGKPRSLYVKKMRRTNHDLNIHPFEISERGIKVIA
jgi:KaiC/GvpD/RAD55 family RecA-like ATPase